MATFLLYESASGYALFEAKDMDWVGDTPQSVAETVKYVFFFFVFFFFSDFLFSGRQIFLSLREGKFDLYLLSSYSDTRLLTARIY
jgi:hypothetical protein